MINHITASFHINTTPAKVPSPIGNLLNAPIAVFLSPEIYHHLPQQKMNVPQEFLGFAIYLQAASQVESRFPAVASLMRMLFVSSANDVVQGGQASPDGELFLMNFVDAHQDEPPSDAVSQTRVAADTYYKPAIDAYNKGRASPTLMKLFLLCRTLYSVIDSPDAEELTKKCDEIYNDIKRKVENANDASGPPPSYKNVPSQPKFNDNVSGPPAFTPNSYRSLNESPNYHTPNVQNNDEQDALSLLNVLGYNILNSASYPPLNKKSYDAIQNLIDQAIGFLKKGNNKDSYNALNNAFHIWTTGSV